VEANISTIQKNSAFVSFLNSNLDCEWVFFFVHQRSHPVESDTRGPIRNLPRREIAITHLAKQTKAHTVNGRQPAILAGNKHWPVKQKTPHARAYSLSGVMIFWMSKNTQCYKPLKILEKSSRGFPGAEPQVKHFCEGSRGNLK
jgi:hypothetical protein